MANDTDTDTTELIQKSETMELSEPPADALSGDSEGEN